MPAALPPGLHLQPRLQLFKSGSMLCHRSGIDARPLTKSLGQGFHLGDTLQQTHIAQQLGFEALAVAPVVPVLGKISHSVGFYRVSP
jgi:hypothetical protein